MNGTSPVLSSHPFADLKTVIHPAIERINTLLDDLSFLLVLFRFPHATFSIMTRTR